MGKTVLQLAMPPLERASVCSVGVPEPLINNQLSNRLLI